MKDATQCIAHGCPEKGTLALSTRGGGFCCRWHFSAAPSDWPGITANLNHVGRPPETPMRYSYVAKVKEGLAR